MSEPFLGEIKIVAFNFPPKGWSLCNGQLLPINQNQALFSILGTTYGGNGTTTFALPNFRGRTPVYTGQGIILGEAGGESSHTLITSEMPAHTHTLGADDAALATQGSPSNNVFGSLTLPLYGPATNLTTLVPSVVSNVGGSQPHTNMQPYLVLNFVIALQGLFPSRN